MKLSSLRKGISPVIATVIIVAITIAIAVAVIGWLTGLWSSLAGGTPAISVTAATGNYTGGNTSAFFINIYLKNTGSGSDKLVKAEFIYNGTAFPCDVVNQVQGKVLSGSSYPFTVNANSEGWVLFKCPASSVSPSPGDKGLMKLYFSTSGAQSFTVVISTVG